jgi:hypothetical protein
MKKIQEKYKTRRSPEDLREMQAEVGTLYTTGGTNPMKVNSLGVAMWCGVVWCGVCVVGLCLPRSTMLAVFDCFYFGLLSQTMFLGMAQAPIWLGFFFTLRRVSGRGFIGSLLLSLFRFSSTSLYSAALPPQHFYTALLSSLSRPSFVVAYSHHSVVFL